MKDREFRFHDGKSGAAIAVRVVPRSARSEIAEILADGTVKVRLEAPNEEKANPALLSFLAQVLEVKPDQMEIVAGLQGSDKLISILGIDRTAVDERIRKQLRR